MTGIALGSLAVVAFAATALITRWLRSYAVDRSLLDHPNVRSAHSKPTPRGGGLSIVLTFLGALTVLAASGAVELTHAFAIGGAGLIVALVGWLDDHRDVAARWRLLAHFVAAAWILSWFGGVPAEEMLNAWGIPTSVIYLFVAVVIVWFINLYNFMDGIDGLASLEAVTIALGGAVTAALAGHSELAPLQFVLAATVSGFLIWNWPPATIFMGDVGSGFLGVVIAGLILMAAQLEPTLLVAWLILLGVFLVDSGYTLLRRAARGEKVYEAHRLHAYQHAARRLRSHAKVTLTVAVINLLWLLPLAIAAVMRLVPNIAALVIAYIPLVGLAWWLGAGCPADPPANAGTVSRGHRTPRADGL